MNAREILHLLTTSPPVPPIALPEAFGIYALWDHDGVARYIGSTPKATEGFHTRIANKHVTGSEGRSHKFSHVYCVGRMWRYSARLHPPEAGIHENVADAKLAKKLRSLFIRRQCGVTYLPIPDQGGTNGYSSYLTSLEHAVQMIAPDSMRLWEGTKCCIADVSSRLLNDLLQEYPHLRSATDRQLDLYNQYIAAPSRLPERQSPAI